jgi:DNA-binding NtrC family response regulator
MAEIERRPPDVLVVDTQWPQRALISAQLIEEGYKVVPVDTWPIPRLYRRPAMTPLVLLIDLQELPHPRDTLDEVRFVMPPERVLVVTALGSMTAQEVREHGFTVIERPATIGQIVAATGRLLSRTRRERSADDASASRP